MTVAPASNALRIGTRCDATTRAPMRSSMAKHKKLKAVSPTDVNKCDAGYVFTAALKLDKDASGN